MLEILPVTHIYIYIYVCVCVCVCVNVPISFSEIFAAVKHLQNTDTSLDDWNKVTFQIFISAILSWLPLLQYKYDEVSVKTFLKILTQFLLSEKKKIFSSNYKDKISISFFNKFTNEIIINYLTGSLLCSCRTKYHLNHFYFSNGPGHLGSIPGRVIPNTLKIVLDTYLLNTQ